MTKKKIKQLNSDRLIRLGNEVIKSYAPDTDTDTDTLGFLHLNTAYYFFITAQQPKQMNRTPIIKFIF